MLVLVLPLLIIRITVSFAAAIITGTLRRSRKYYVVVSPPFAFILFLLIITSFLKYIYMFARPQIKCWHNQRRPLPRGPHSHTHTPHYRHVQPASSVLLLFDIIFFVHARASDGPFDLYLTMYLYFCIYKIPLAVSDRIPHIIVYDITTKSGGLVARPSRPPPPHRIIFLSTLIRCGEWGARNKQIRDLRSLRSINLQAILNPSVRRPPVGRATVHWVAGVNSAPKWLPVN